MHRPAQKILPVLLLVYAAASLAHFVHNAEYLADYPGLPVSWTREGVYAVWVAITLIGVVGWLLAPMSGHTAAMNSTILVEVTAAALVFVEAMRKLWQNLGSRLRGNDSGNA